MQVEVVEVAAHSPPPPGRRRPGRRHVRAGRPLSRQFGRDLTATHKFTQPLSRHTARHFTGAPTAIKVRLCGCYLIHLHRQLLPQVKNTNVTYIGWDGKFWQRYVGRHFAVHLSVHTKHSQDNSGQVGCPSPVNAVVRGTIPESHSSFSRSTENGPAFS